MKLLLTVFILHLFASPTLAQGVSPADEQAIDATMAKAHDALTAMDFNAFAATLTDDVDWVNVIGMHWVGKPQVVKGHTITFTTRADAQLALGVVMVRAILGMDDSTAQDGKRQS